MTISPNDLFIEFENHFSSLPDHSLHDMLTENEIKIFYTPEGQLSTEQGVYVAETIAAKNSRLPKGRFKVYGDQDGLGNAPTDLSVQRETSKKESINMVKKDTGKGGKKNVHVEKAKTAKEEAKELLLKEKTAIRHRVKLIQKNLSVMLMTLGQMAIANPIFTHGQLPTLVKYVDPLLHSSIVGDAAFETMLNLARCLAPPLSSWAHEIAAALRLISAKDVHVVLELTPPVESHVPKGPSSGIFEQIVNGLSVSCKAGPLPADSFTFIFPVIEHILLSPKKTALHDDLLHILSMHLDPILPLPRPRMLLVLYHVLGGIPAYQPLIGPMLNELCLGIQADELAKALSGVFAKDLHVRLACLTAIKCIPFIPDHVLQDDALVTTSIWIALHDPEKSLLINGRGQYNCSLAAHLIQGSSTCKFTSNACKPVVLQVLPNKTYRLRIASTTSLASLNLAIGNHKLTVVEADGNYVKPFSVDDMDIYSGESYSVLITTDQNPSSNYWLSVGVRGREPNTPPALAIINYRPNSPSKLPDSSPPVTPVWNDYAHSKSFTYKILAKEGTPRPPPHADKTIALLNTQNKLDGYTKWAINNVSLALPTTPYLGSMTYHVNGAYDPQPPPENFPLDYDVMKPAKNPNTRQSTNAYVFQFKSTVDVILQNANALKENVSEIHPWHLHGHDFWVLGYGEGRFQEKDASKFNLKNPPLRNTVVIFPHGWTALRFVADNPGVWAFHCHIEPHLHMGMGVIFAEGVDNVNVSQIPKNAIACGMLINNHLP